MYERSQLEPLIKLLAGLEGTSLKKLLLVLDLDGVERESCDWAGLDDVLQRPQFQSLTCISVHRQTAASNLWPYRNDAEIYGIYSPERTHQSSLLPRTAKRGILWSAENKPSHWVFTSLTESYRHVPF